MDDWLQWRTLLVTRQLIADFILGSLFLLGFLFFLVLLWTGNPQP